MNQLVVIQNRQVVTTSLQIAESFNKEHRNVLRDIEGLLKTEHTQHMFFEDTYEHPQNKQSYKMYYTNRDGFTLLAMGFNGHKSLEFKLKYIQAFNAMEEQLQPQPLSEKEQLKASMRLSLETSEEVETLKVEVNEVKQTVQTLVDTMRIDGNQEAQINKRAREVIVIALGGKESTAYKKVSRQVFSAFWRDFKNHFEVPRYGEIPKTRFAESIKFISMWQPSTTLRMEINSYNQQELKLIEGGAI
ncbi:ORF6C domain-containing protein [Lysinibacillus sp. NPDC047702]|uniref:ORF6C domain-containing protein n=1 Tax=unclassified Lysinibacillus TaxID=2636778 RepID=UPI003CFEA728